MNLQLNKREPNASRRKPVPRDEIQHFPRKISPSVLLFRARQTLGVSRQLMAQEMGISQSLLRKFEFGEVKIPASFLLKIFMFGLDFWADGIYWTMDNSEKKSK